MPKVQMPQLGESVAEGTIGKWLKKPGDHVDKYEPIVEVITDKVNAEVPSPFEGTLTEILAQEGETVPNGAEIATIEATGAAAEATGAAAEATGAAAEAPAKAAEASAAKSVEPKVEEAAAPAGPYGAGNGPGGSDESPERTLEQPTAQPTAVSTATAVAAPSKAGGNGASGGNGATAPDYAGPTTPAVRKLAREHSIDLALVAGTGHGGRVTRDDVMKFVESGGAAAKAPAAPPPSSAPPSSAPPSSAPTAQPAQSVPSSAPAQSAPSAPSPVAQGDSLKQPSPMRRAIATQMSKSLQIPVAYTVVEVDMSGVVALRDGLKGNYQAQEGIGLTYDAFVAKATVEALKRSPDFNAHFTEEGHWLRQAVNLGIAVAVDDGLVVPVVHAADTLSIHGLNRAIRDLADKSRGNKLTLDDISGGTFTLDNTGWTGALITQPIINAPQVGILTM
ncbi:MAG: dihydrolipoamide acetyltransferase family protein, partial [Chloroflexota bacterium]